MKEIRIISEPRTKVFDWNSQLNANSLVIAQTMVQLQFSGYNVKGFAWADTPEPEVKEQDDCYIVQEDATIWGEEVVTFNIFRWNAAWEILPVKINELQITGSFMAKGIYDTNDSGVVDDTEKLNGQNAAYYLARSSHTGTQAPGTIEWDENNRTVTDTEKNTWNAKQNALTANQIIDWTVTGAEDINVDRIPALDYEALDATILRESGVVDDLTSIINNKPLSANQGKVLKGLIDNINTLLTSDDTTLDELQEIVDYIKQNKSTLDTLGISNIAGLQSALDAKSDVHTHPYRADTWVPTWNDVTGKPSTFAPTAHSHTIAEITNLQDALDGKAPTHSHPYRADTWVPDWSDVTGKPNYSGATQKTSNAGALTIGFTDADPIIIYTQLTENITAPTLNTTGAVIGKFVEWFVKGAYSIDMSAYEPLDSSVDYNGVEGIFQLKAGVDAANGNVKFFFNVINV